MTTAISQPRFAALDIAKGIAIIVIVLSHCIDRTTLPGMFFGAFHVPIFFIISGLCFNELKYTEFAPFLVKRFRQLIVPTYGFALLFALAFALVPREGTWSLAEITHVVPGALWFLVVLFLTEILYFWIVKLVKLLGGGKITLLIIALVFLGIGLAFSHYRMVGPYSICRVFYATTCYTIGNTMRGHLGKIDSCPMKALWGCVAILVVVAFAFYWHHSGTETALDVFPTKVITSLAGTIGVLLLSSFIHDRRWRIESIFLWLGKNTLGIMASHMLFLYLCSALIRDSIPSPLGYKLTEQVFVWAFSILTCIVLNRWAKWLVGKV